MAGRRRSGGGGELGFHAAHRRRVEQYEQRLAQAQGLHRELLVTAQFLAATVKQNPDHAATARPLVMAMAKVAHQIASQALQAQVSTSRKD